MGLEHFGARPSYDAEDAVEWCEDEAHIIF